MPKNNVAAKTQIPFKNIKILILSLSYWNAAINFANICIVDETNQIVLHFTVFIH